MEPLPVVEDLDVLHHVEPRLLAGGETMPVVHLVLEHREPRLGDSVVVARAGATDRESHVELLREELQSTGELGDLLLQVLFHARIAADDPESPFDIDDVARSFTSKVTGRTPGVLSGAHSDLETQIREWEERKAAEKRRGSVFDGVATTQPALALVQKVLERLTAAGYPVDTIPAETLTVTVVAGGDSVEAQARDRALALMADVRAAEARAAERGVTLDSPEAWSAVLGENPA